MLAKGAAAVLLEAATAAPTASASCGRSRVERRPRVAEKDGVPAIVGLFTSNQLDLALGRTNVIHAALASRRAGESFLARCRRLAAYRGVALDGAPLVAQAMRNDEPDAERPDGYG